MFRKHRPEVLIVGAGPVGLFTALQFHERGMGVHLIDEQPRTAAQSYALALHARSLDLLAGLGLADAVGAEGLRVNRIALYDGADRRAEMDLSRLPGDHPYVLAIRQSTLERALEEALRKRGIDVHWNHRLSDLEVRSDRIHAEIDRLEKVSSGYAIAVTEWAVGKRLRFEPRYVIGADGHRSFVRRTLGIDHAAHGDPLFFAVFELEVDGSVGDEMRISIADGLMNALWPLPDGRCRWSFQVADPRQPPEPRYKSRVAVHMADASAPALTAEHLRGFLAERAPWFGAKPKEITWSMIVRFESRLASDFGRGRMWLAGDSAHLTGPVGIQSMNVGLREGFDLATRISEVHRGAASEGVLDEYSRRRAEEWKALLGLTARLSPSGPEQWIHGHAADLLSCIPASGEDLETLARQIGLELRSPSDS
jgi:2-polyprenyl-6-methoxyphenol hydroxylase-like FAD-dependent oxidoreductase